MAGKPFGLAAFGWRWLIALLLVLLTYNPSGYSYVGWWLDQGQEGMLSVRIIAGLILLAAFIIFLRATLKSLGAVGIIIALAILGCLVWLLIDLGWVDPASRTVMSWIILVAVATVLALGISWSHIRRRWTGQIDTDEV